ncbi:hypothetical protein DENSPDRAFT_933560 [Dentipellis sp. KUC8613]|nr:hypothetical protein DENSPDRAFT_933560 [Dentipellis sp. KUC8613]
MYSYPGYSAIPAHLQEELFPTSHEFTSQSIATLLSRQSQHTFSPGDLEAGGAYTFANPNLYSSFPLNEPLPLLNRPPEDIHLGAPQAPPIALRRGPGIYVQHRGPYDCQQYEDAFDAPYAPPPLPRREMFPLPQAQWSPGSLLYGSAPSSSAPRSCWASNGSPRYAPPIPPPPVNLNPPGIQIGHFMCPSSFDASRTGVENEAPLSAPILLRSTTQFVAQPPAQAYSMPGYGELRLGYDDIPMSAGPHSSPGQQMAPGSFDTSLRDRSNYQELHASRREGADPFAPQTARSGQKARSTLATDINRTPANDRGHEDIAGLFTDRSLPLPSQGSDAPSPTTGARGSKKAKHTKRTRRTRAKDDRPTQKIPEAVKLGNGRWGCPYEGCIKTFHRKYDMRRHWKAIHADDKTVFYYTRCSSTLNRSDNAWRHIRVVHDGVGHVEDIVEIECGEQHTALWDLQGVE